MILKLFLFSVYETAVKVVKKVLFLQEEEIDKNKIEELTEIISQLQLDKTQSLNESGNLAVQLERALNNSGRCAVI